jgi:hypothetical protein
VSVDGRTLDFADLDTPADDGAIESVIAAVVSYEHAYPLVRGQGETDWTATDEWK